MTALPDVEKAAELIDGRAIARALKDAVMREVKGVREYGISCGLAVGINALEDPETHKVSMVGDVDTASARTVARAVTPVPGGIGPVTDVWLLRNTIAAADNITAAADRRRVASETVNETEMSSHERR